MEEIAVKPNIRNQDKIVPNTSSPSLPSSISPYHHSVTMLSLSSSTLFSSSKLPDRHLRRHHKHPSTTITCNNYLNSPSPNAPSNAPSPLGLIIPKSPSSTAVPGNFYQPYRPPPSPLPTKYKSLDIQSIVEVLANRQGLWFEYAPLISSLFREGFTPPIIEELTGISGVEQNCLIVAAQVRESIAELNEVSEEYLSYFDPGGSEILYELRLLSAEQRSASAEYIVQRRLDGAKAREIAKAIKDFPRRQDEPGFRCFDYTKPGDCWAFWHFRLSREFPNPSEKRTSALNLALDVAETDKAKERIKEEIEGKGSVSGEASEGEAVVVPVVRLRMGEVAEATTVVVLPVVEAKEGESAVGRVPLKCKSEGEFGVVVSDKGWDRWVVLPRWVPIAGIGSSGVAVAFSNARVLPWRLNREYVEEPVLVVADRARRWVEVEDGFYLVGGVDDGVEGGFKVEKGYRLKEMGVSESLGTVVVVVRPPKDEMDDQISDEEWD